MATAKIEERVGIVLSRIPQKEHDAMVRCLGEEGFFSFYGRGALKVGGSNASATQELALGRFNLVVSNSGALTLKEARLARLYAPAGGVEGMLVAQLLLEFCLRCVSEDDAPAMHPLLTACLDALEKGADPYTVAIIYLAKGSQILGNGLEVGHCVLCGAKTGIVTLDFAHGGFLCRDCLDASSAAPCPSEELKIYRHAYLCPLEDLGRVIFPETHAKAALRELLRYAHEFSGLRLRALDPILPL